MPPRKPSQHLLPSRSQPHLNLPAVVPAPVTPDETIRFQAIDQADGAMMPNLQTLRENPDCRFLPVRHSLELEQRLVLLRLEAGSLRRPLAEFQVMPNRIPEISHCLIIGVGSADTLHETYNYIVIRWKIPVAD